MLRNTHSSSAETDLNINGEPISSSDFFVYMGIPLGDADKTIEFFEEKVETMQHDFSLTSQLSLQDRFCIVRSQFISSLNYWARASFDLRPILNTLHQQWIETFGIQSVNRNRIRQPVGCGGLGWWIHKGPPSIGALAEAAFGNGQEANYIKNTILPSALSWLRDCRVDDEEKCLIYKGCQIEIGKRTQHRLYCKLMSDKEPDEVNWPTAALLNSWPSYDSLTLNDSEFHHLLLMHLDSMWIPHRYHENPPPIIYCKHASCNGVVADKGHWLKCKSTHKMKMDRHNQISILISKALKQIGESEVTLDIKQSIEIGDQERHPDIISTHFITHHSELIDVSLTAMPSTITDAFQNGGNANMALNSLLKQTENRKKRQYENGRYRPRPNSTLIPFILTTHGHLSDSTKDWWKSKWKNFSKASPKRFMANIGAILAKQSVRAAIKWLKINPSARSTASLLQSEERYDLTDFDVDLFSSVSDDENEEPQAERPHGGSSG
jgi:hypothetical protein